MGGLRFSPFALYALSLACADSVLLLIVVGYAYCFRLRNWAPPNHDVEMPRQQQVEAAGLQVVVAAYRGDAREEFSSDECVICLEGFEEGEECWVMKTCGHVYHESCIKEWLARNQRCPLCRGSVREAREASLTAPPTAS
ncbi:hypothetical protein BT93_L4304 [Corymbia citriodora subsp. variegata]|uniref:RING-type domain-containing protein n=1 Tax=Corymbia citriodora subsp. variegata TaxID=360336 RepID=A0A8T0CFZ8_CORYI|nr:hypothetical protein BT93_L4304 [Corymbia citriodora subsp. variegata]